MAPTVRGEEYRDIASKSSPEKAYPGFFSKGAFNRSSTIIVFFLKRDRAIQGVDYLLYTMIYIYTKTYIYICICIYTCTYIYMHINIYIYMYLSIHVYVYTYQ